MAYSVVCAAVVVAIDIIMTEFGCCSWSYLSICYFCFIFVVIFLMVAIVIVIVVVVVIFVT